MTIVMDPEIKARWVQALRSGEYNQAKGALNVIEEGLCCLGVLCEIAVVDNVVNSVILEDNHWVRYGVNPSTQELWATSYLPEKVTEWASFESNKGPFFLYHDIEKYLKGNYNGYFDTYSGSRWVTLPVLNDAGVPFSEIADIIEGEL